jgi:hypothetical protein
LSWDWGQITILLTISPKIAYNKGNIEPLRVGHIKKHTAVVFGDSVYMARQGINAGDIHSGLAAPSTWVKSKDGTLSMNPYWARVNMNATVDPTTGQLNRYIYEGQGEFGGIYRRATDKDPIVDQVYLNVQKPVKTAPKSLDSIVSNNIDGIITRDKGIETDSGYK